MIDFQCEIYRRLGIKQLSVQINTVGDAASRESYKEALKAYLSPYFAELSADSQVRFTKNILRILDSKDPKDQEILKGAPHLSDLLSHESKAHFDQVLSLLQKLNIACNINPKLVRGLDYYNQTVFEITTEVLGAQNAIGGGGRYDGLIEAVGGPNLPGIGFATGMERILQTMLKQGAPFPTPAHPFVFFVPMGEAAKNAAFELVCKLRHKKIRCDIDLSGKKVQHGLQMADKLGAEYVVVLGEEELQTQKIKVKNMATRETQEYAMGELISHLEKTHV